MNQELLMDKKSFDIKKYTRFAIVSDIGSTNARLAMAGLKRRVR